MSYYIDFERHELLFFFDYEKILEDDAGIVKYSLQDQNKMTFSLYISTYDQYVVISLKEDAIEKYIFEIGLKDIHRITCDKQNLYFYKKENDNFTYQDINLIEPFLTVQVKPTVAISIDL